MIEKEENIHTSIALRKDLHDRIKSTKRPLNSIVTEALEFYLSGGVDKDKLKEAIQEQFNSKEMQAFFKIEMYNLLMPAISAYMPKVQKDEIRKKLEKEKRL